MNIKEFKEHYKFLISRIEEYVKASGYNNHFGRKYDFNITSIKFCKYDLLEFIGEEITNHDKPHTFENDIELRYLMYDDAKWNEFINNPKINNI